MRVVALLLAVTACAPKVATSPRVLDEDLGDRAALSEPAAPAAAPSLPAAPSAPAGPRVRAGSIARDRLVAVLDAGPASFLRQLEVVPQLAGDRFVGWQLVQLLDRTGPLRDVDLVPGDVLLSVNGRAVSRPEQLQSVWDSLRTADELTAQLTRAGARVELRFAIEPALRPRS